MLKPTQEIGPPPSETGLGVSLWAAKYLLTHARQNRRGYGDVKTEMEKSSFIHQLQPLGSRGEGWKENHTENCQRIDLILPAFQLVTPSEGYFKVARIACRNGR